MGLLGRTRSGSASSHWARRRGAARCALGAGRAGRWRRGRGPRARPGTSRRCEAGRRGRARGRLPWPRRSSGGRGPSSRPRRSCFAVETVVAGIGVGLHVAFVVFQEFFGAFAAAGPGEVVNGVGVIGVAEVDPQVGAVGLDLVLNRDGGVVGVDDGGLEHAFLHGADTARGGLRRPWSSRTGSSARVRRRGAPGCSPGD